MRDYEIMIIIDSSLEEEPTKKIVKKLEDLINKNKGKTKKVDEWGRRKLAYPISGHTDGYYTLIDFEGESETINELDRISKITDGVIRYMVTKKEV